ncbi:MAG: MFS transporter [Acidobacteria bacterium]|nr:MFS transporter [Acidobacteriota bacterium]
MATTSRIEEIRTGFSRPFWVANITELFERLSYYAVFATLANYLQDRSSALGAGFTTQETSSLTGWFGGTVWFLAVFGGAVADKLGFRRALSVAYLILAVAYFLLGSIASSWLAPVRAVVPLWLLVLIILILPALGIAMVKPSVVGTTARASRENVRSLGYSIYYTLVNVGGAAGPYLAGLISERMSTENVYRMAACSVLLMFFAVLLFYREPRRSDDAPPPSIAQTARNFATVAGNLRFMAFLLIFSGFWVVYWQQYIALPLFLRKYQGIPAPTIDKLLITDALTVICLQIAVSYLTKRAGTFRAIIAGTLISSLSWVIVALHPSVGGAVAALVVLALGEITLSPRYYEYVSRLAPPEKQGTYMGFAFVPIGIGSWAGGVLSGFLMHHFAELQHRPAMVWWSFVAFGLLSTLLLWAYDRLVQPGKA